MQVLSDPELSTAKNGGQMDNRLFFELKTLLIFAIPCILAHACKNRPGLKTPLYCLYAFYLFAFFADYLPAKIESSQQIWAVQALGLCGGLAFLSLFKNIRVFYSKTLTGLNRLLLFPFEKIRATVQESSLNASTVSPEASMTRQLFLPDSIPHLNGLFLFLLVLGLVMRHVNFSGVGNPFLNRPPSPIHTDFLYALCISNTLIVVALGVGLFQGRSFKAVLERLRIVKPGAKEIGVALLIVLFTFIYDMGWSAFTHASTHAGAYSTLMNKYNLTSFLAAANGGLASALFISLWVALMAGIEEEVLMRGALQPALGIIPAAFLHACLHTQFAGAPVLMLQIFIWSALVGVVKHYTNTTTTILGHAGFNLISTFLICFNP